MSFFFFSSGRRHTSCLSDWSSDVCSSDVLMIPILIAMLLDDARKNILAEIVAGLGVLGIGDEDRDHEVSVEYIDAHGAVDRSEERRVGKESRTRESPEKLTYR